LGAHLGPRLDIVVNNAGWSHRNKPMLKVTEEEFDQIYSVNLRSIFHMTRAAVPAMRATGGAGSCHRDQIDVELAPPPA
jgi:3-oxoacyl-[acyl-carrier protein] reductase